MKLVPPDRRIERMNRTEERPPGRSVLSLVKINKECINWIREACVGAYVCTREAVRFVMDCFNILRCW